MPEFSLFEQQQLDLQSASVTNYTFVMVEIGVTENVWIRKIGNCGRLPGETSTHLWGNEQYLWRIVTLEDGTYEGELIRHQEDFLHHETVDGWAWQVYEPPNALKLRAGEKYRLGFTIYPGYTAFSTNDYWTTGDGSAGITNGPLYAPSKADAVDQIQGPYYDSAENNLSFHDVISNGANYAVDLVVVDKWPLVTQSEYKFTCQAVPVVTDIAYDEAAQLARRTPTVESTVRWGDKETDYNTLHTGLLESFSYESSLTSELPEETTLFEGYTSQQYSFQMSGKPYGNDDEGRIGDLEAYEVFSPYRDDSPLHLEKLLGSEVDLHVGFNTLRGKRLTKLFQGRIRDHNVNSQSGVVSMSALSDSERMHTTVQMPYYGSLKKNIQFEEGDYQILPPQAVNSHWVVDYILRQCGIYTSPPPQPNSLFYVSGHGGMVPDIGQVEPPTTRVFYPTEGVDYSWGTNGPFGGLTVPGTAAIAGHMNYSSDRRVRLNSSLGINIAFWIDTSTPVEEHVTFAWMRLETTLTDPTWYISFERAGNGDYRIAGHFNDINNGSPLVFLEHGDPDVEPGWHLVEVQLWFDSASGSSDRAEVFVDGSNVVLYHTTIDVGFNRDHFVQVQHYLTPRAPWSDYQVFLTDEFTSDPWTADDMNFVNPHKIGYGNTELAYIPPEEGDAWEMLKEVAAAEFAVFYFDQESNFHYEPYLPPKSLEPDMEITASRSLQDLDITMDTDGIRNIISREVHYASYVSAELYNATNFGAWVVGTGFHYRWFDLPNGSYIPGIVQLTPVSPANWDNTQENSYCAVLVRDATTTAQFAMSVYVMTASRGRGLAVIVNNAGEPVQFTTNQDDGEDPALRINGWKMEDLPSFTRKQRHQGSIDYWGESALSLPQSVWAQDTRPGFDPYRLAVESLCYPVPKAQPLSIVPDPRIRPGMIVRIRDPHRLAESFRAYVVKTQFDMSMDNGDVSQTITIRAVGSPGLGLLNDPELGLVTDTLILGP